MQIKVGGNKPIEMAAAFESGNWGYSWQTQKMSDKLQFVAVFGSVRLVEASDKLKFVGHFHRPFALLPSLPKYPQLPRSKGSADLCAGFTQL